MHSHSLTPALSSHSHSLTHWSAHALALALTRTFELTRAPQRPSLEDLRLLTRSALCLRCSLMCCFFSCVVVLFQYFDELIVCLDPSLSGFQKELDVFAFHADWADASFSLLGPNHVKVPAYRKACDEYTGCVPQKGTANTLSAGGNGLNFRAAYRSFFGFDPFTNRGAEYSTAASSSSGYSSGPTAGASSSYPSTGASSSYPSSGASGSGYSSGSGYPSSGASSVPSPTGPISAGNVNGPNCQYPGRYGSTGAGSYSHKGGSGSTSVDRTAFINPLEDSLCTNGGETNNLCQWLEARSIVHQRAERNARAEQHAP